MSQEDDLRGLAKVIDFMRRAKAKEKVRKRKEEENNE